MLRSFADRLEALRSTLLPAAGSGHPSETAWPMTHLVGLAAEASDEYLFRVSEPGTDRALLAALTAATANTALALSGLAAVTNRLLTASSEEVPSRVGPAVAQVDDLVALAARELREAAERLAPAPLAPVADLSRLRGAQSAAALARSKAVSVQPATTDQSPPAARGATVIPLHRGR
ncbi:hypothetical protein [Kitasatospora sp. NPDC057015]|uniref:hypothetical protein n=1 Tax=Kitasatospora sp. NPDC057015 TaxID=3346001 RepID=UPI003634C1D9